MPRICAVGDNVVDRYIDRGVMYPGGNTVNVAVHARRCGADAAYLGALGDDDAGRVVARALTAEAVDISRVRVLPGSNAYAEVRVVEGDRVFGNADAGVSAFTLTEDDYRYLATFDLVHTGDCSFLENQLADMAKVRPVSFDFSNRPFAYAEPLLQHVAVATFSASGASDDEVREILDRACGAGVSTVIVTRGSAGAVVFDGTTVASRAPERTDVVDTLGAGDAFIARALVALLEGGTSEQIVEAATVYAARTCQYFGAFGHEAPDSAGPSRATPGDPIAAHPRN